MTLGQWRRQLLLFRVKRKNKIVVLLYRQLFVIVHQEANFIEARGDICQQGILYRNFAILHRSGSLDYSEISMISRFYTTVLFIYTNI